MLRRLGFIWRLFATTTSFLLFGLGGLVSGITLFPVIYFLPISLQSKQNLSRDLIRWMFRLFVMFMRGSGILKYEVQGERRLITRQDHLIVANHPTLIDVVFLLSLARRPTCVVKSGVWNNPFMHFVVRAAGFIHNQCSPEVLLQRCVRALQKGEGLVIFPEGTRTATNGIIDMKRGAARVALAAEKNMTPITIQCQPITLTKQHKWYVVPSQVPRFKICVGKELEIGQFSEKWPEASIAARHLTNRLQEYFNERVEAEKSNGK